MMSFVSNVHVPQLESARTFDPYRYTNPSYHVAQPASYSHQSLNGSPQQLLPRDVLEQRARTPCKHFEYHQGWCPYGLDCHFFHDHSRLASRPGSTAPISSPSPSAYSTTSSLRSSPVPSTIYYSSTTNQYSASSASPLPHDPVFSPQGTLSHAHALEGPEFTPRTIGGTTYFPIRLDGAHLGYVTPIGVQVFTGN